MRYNTDTEITLVMEINNGIDGVYKRDVDAGYRGVGSGYRGDDVGHRDVEAGCRGIDVGYRGVGGGYRGICGGFSCSYKGSVFVKNFNNFL